MGAAGGWGDPQTSYFFFVPFFLCRRQWGDMNTGHRILSWQIAWQGLARRGQPGVGNGDFQDWEGYSETP